MHLQKCPGCQQYTLAEFCKDCKSDTMTAHPAKFSPHDVSSAQRIETYKKNPGSHPILSPK
ncbi:Ribosome biogenesis protein Nop10 [Spironucleus salmonicida]|uniref:Nucleolar protein 10 n=1 Tax=Spironucleus salmonicida TaxID=348837 RepID=V6LNB9_9EUKA|nr:Ribosome biogenesis protein Nop10 [Spironucleus salmonicida]|eukprot:EST45728.1 Ribosome biogenesis protein Nop10 [Spironucleus salmonicida]